MSAIDNGGPAFPTTEANYQMDYSCSGVTVRDWFAGKALRIAWEAFDKGYFEANDDANDRIAKCAYQMADAMLKARKEQP